MLKHSEITALVQLLDDEDREVLDHVQQKLKSFGAELLPALTEIGISGLPPLTHQRLEQLIRDIQFDLQLEEWRQYLGGEYQDLLDGFILLSRYHYPDMDVAAVRKKIQKIKQSIWLELNPNQTPLEQIQIFNQVFYLHQGFTAVQNATALDELCLHKLLETQQGAAIAVGILYQTIAHELTLPVYGINLTRHYALAFCKRAIINFSSIENLEKEIMFYINPVNKGNIFSRNEIKDYLNKLDIESKPEYFTPADNRSILRELLNYQIELCRRNGYLHTEKDLQQFLLLL